MPKCRRQPNRCRSLAGLAELPKSSINLRILLAVAAFLMQDVGAGLAYLISGETGFGVSFNLF